MSVGTEGLTHSIVRPTAYFKSLDGQIESAKRGTYFTQNSVGRILVVLTFNDVLLVLFTLCKRVVEKVGERKRLIE